MLTRSILPWSLLGLFLALQASAATERTRVAGTQLTLVPPERFVVAERFPGFQREDLQASIMVSEMPAPIDAVQAGMTREGLASKGMTLVASETVQVAGSEALLIRATQEAAGIVYDKQLLIAGDADKTVLLVANYPSSAVGELSAPVRSALLTLRWQTDDGPIDLEGLLFHVEPTGRLVIRQRLSNALLLASEGSSIPSAPGEPILVVTNSFRPVDTSDLEAAARRRLSQLEQATGIGEVTSRELVVDGIRGIELTGHASDARTGLPLVVYQVLLPEGGHYFILQGMVAAEQADAYVPEFRRVTESFRRSPANR